MTTIEQAAEEILTLIVPHGDFHKAAVRGMLQRHFGEAVKDKERLDVVERKMLHVQRAGYRGRDGWEVLVAWPGGHYQEERMKAVGRGTTARAAIDAARAGKEQR